MNDVYVINDKAMENTLVDDLVEQKNYTEMAAKEWVKAHGDAVVSIMWYAYSKYLDENSEYIEIEDEDM